MKKSGKAATDRGMVVVFTLKKAIVFNDNVITKARIEIDHINYGLNRKTGALNKKARTNFTVADIEKFLALLDMENTFILTIIKGDVPDFDTRSTVLCRGGFTRNCF
jgi:hypothetical protein